MNESKTLTAPRGGEPPHSPTDEDGSFSGRAAILAASRGRDAQAPRASCEGPNKTPWRYSLPERYWLLGIFALGWAVRCVYLFQVRSTPIVQGLSMDSALFERLARQLAAGDWGARDSIFLNEFYQFYLAALYRLLGPEPMPVLALQTFVDALSGVLIAFVGWKAFGRTVGIAAGLAYALYGIAIFYTGLVLDTTVSIFLQMAFLSLLLTALAPEAPRSRGLFAGLVFGLLLLARPNLALFLAGAPLLGRLLLRQFRDARKVVATGLLFVAGTGVVLGLSAWRHHIHFGSWSPFAAHGGFNLYIGNNPEAEGIFMSPSGVSSNPVSQIKNSIRMASKETGRDMGPYEASGYWTRRSLEYLLSHPLEGARLTVMKLFLFLRREEISLNIDYSLSSRLVPLFRLPLLTYGIVSPLAMVGVVLVAGRVFFPRKHISPVPSSKGQAPLDAADPKAGSLERDEEPRRTEQALLLLAYATAAASVILFFISDRYRLPVVPLSILFAAVAAWTLVETGQRRSLGELGGLAALLCGAVLITHAPFPGMTHTQATGTHYNNLAMVYLRNGEPDKAEAELGRALEIDPLLAASHNNLGQLHVEQGRMEEGVRSLRRALELDPHYAVAHYNLGMALERMGQVQEARLHYERAVDLSPNLGEPRVNLGNLLLRAGERERGLQQLRAAVEEDPGLTEGWEALGNAHAAAGEVQAALGCFAKVLAEEPDHYNALVNTGLLHKRMGRPDEAVKLFEKAIAAHPERSEGHLHLGAVLAAANRREEAVRHLLKALELDPESYEASLKLGIEYARSGELGPATAHFKRASKIRPQGEEARLNLVKAYLVGGDLVAARREYEVLLQIAPEAARQVELLFATFGQAGDGKP